VWGNQVLYLTEPIDEPAVNAIGEFGEFKFVDVTREGLDLGDVPEEDKKKVRARWGAKLGPSLRSAQVAPEHASAAMLRLLCERAGALMLLRMHWHCTMRVCQVGPFSAHGRC
jgi:heat shock protein beta